MIPRAKVYSFRLSGKHRADAGKIPSMLIRRTVFCLEGSEISLDPGKALSSRTDKND